MSAAVAAQANRIFVGFQLSSRRHAAVRLFTRKRRFITRKMILVPSTVVLAIATFGPAKVADIEGLPGDYE